MLGSKTLPMIGLIIHIEGKSYSQIQYFANFVWKTRSRVPRD